MGALGINLSAVAGLLVGSIVWVLAANVTNGRSPVASPPCTADGMSNRRSRRGTSSATESSSRCSGTIGPLGWLPLYGFGLALKCRTCRRRQPLWRIAVELGVSGYFAACAYRHGNTLGYWEAVIFAVPLLLILLVDAWSRLIYTNTIVGGAVLGVGLAFGYGWQTGLNAIATGIGTTLILGGLFLLASRAYQTSKALPFGLGDVYLAGMIGTMTRFPDIFPTLFIGVLLTGFTLLMLYVTDKTEGRVPVPFGPFLCLAAMIILATPGRF